MLWVRFPPSQLVGHSNDQWESRVGYLYQAWNIWRPHVVPISSMEQPHVVPYQSMEHLDITCKIPTPRMEHLETPCGTYIKHSATPCSTYQSMEHLDTPCNIPTPSMEHLKTPWFPKAEESSHQQSSSLSLMRRCYLLSWANKITPTICWTLQQKIREERLYYVIISFLSVCYLLSWVCRPQAVFSYQLHHAEWCWWRNQKEYE